MAAMAYTRAATHTAVPTPMTTRAPRRPPELGGGGSARVPPAGASAATGGRPGATNGVRRPARERPLGSVAGSTMTPVMLRACHYRPRIAPRLHIPPLARKLA